MNRLLVVLPNWFGETLFVTPFIRLLRKQNPGSFIAVLGWPQTHEVLFGNPYINLLIAFDEQGSHRGLMGKYRLAKELRSQKFDAAFILRRSLSRTWLLACAGIKKRVGFSNKKSGLLLTHSVAPAANQQHKAASYLPLLGPAVAGAMDERCDYKVTSPEKESAEALLKSQGLRPGFALLHIGANWPHKRWPNERFAQLSDRLMAKGFQVVISGSPGDIVDAVEIEALMKQKAYLWVGKTKLRELAACAAFAGVVVANDTGVMHIAAALERPVIALFGPTDPSITGPLGDPAKTVVIHHRESCPQIPCYQPDSPPHPGMKSISVDEVYAAACAFSASQA